MVTIFYHKSFLSNFGDEVQMQELVRLNRRLFLRRNHEMFQWNTCIDRSSVSLNDSPNRTAKSKHLRLEFERWESLDTPSNFSRAMKAWGLPENSRQTPTWFAWLCIRERSTPTSRSTCGCPCASSCSSSCPSWRQRARALKPQFTARCLTRQKRWLRARCITTGTLLPPLRSCYTWSSACSDVRFVLEAGGAWQSRA